MTPIICQHGPTTYANHTFETTCIRKEVLRQAAATCLFGSGNAGLNKDPRSRSGKEPVTADFRDGRRAEKARGWRHDAKFHAQKDSDLQATSIFFSFSIL